MSKQPVYVGIDVAFAKKKRLPICVCTNDGVGIEPLRLRDEFVKPPAGNGNKAALNEAERMTFATAVLNWLKKLEIEKSLVIHRIAIDAPSNYATGQRRLAECALDEEGISCFATPTKAQFDQKIQDALDHIAAGGKEAEMPNANQLWMLVGFSLFRALEAKYECIEVFPQAIVRAIGCSGAHKLTVKGFEEQVNQFAKLTGQTASDVTAHIAYLGFGGTHDRLDAFLSAWVASLPIEMRRAYGLPPDDAIWIPDISKFCPPGNGKESS